MRNKTVKDKYTPLEEVYMLDATRKLDNDTMKEVQVFYNIREFKIYDATATKTSQILHI